MGCGARVNGLYGYAKADAQTPLPAKAPANIKNIQLLREAYHSCAFAEKLS